MKKDLLFYNGSILRVDPEAHTYSTDDLDLNTLFQSNVPPLGFMSPCVRFLSPWQSSVELSEYLFRDGDSALTASGLYKDSRAILIMESTPFANDHGMMPWHSFFFDLRYSKPDLFYVDRAWMFYAQSALNDSSIELFVPKSAAITPDSFGQLNLLKEPFGVCMNEFNAFYKDHFLPEVYDQDDLYLKGLKVLPDVVKYNFSESFELAKYEDAFKKIYPTREVLVL